MSKETEEKIDIVCQSLAEFLKTKNRNYGNSALDPINIFSKQTPEGALMVRLDDKMSRIQNSSELRKNDAVDTLGYIVLACIMNDWLDFKDLIDQWPET